MTKLRIAAAGAAVAAGVLGSMAAGVGPAGASSWLSCASGTTQVFGGSYTVYTFGNGELRFQACRTEDGDIARMRTQYVKRAGNPVQVTLGWQWVTPSGSPLVGEGPGGGSHRHYAVSAGQRATFDGPVYYAEEGRLDPYSQYPGGRYTCVRGWMSTYGTGDETVTPKACF